MIRFNSAEKSFTLIIYYEDKSKQTVNRQTPNTSLEKTKQNKTNKQINKNVFLVSQHKFKKMKTDLKFFSFLY